MINQNKNIIPSLYYLYRLIYTYYNGSWYGCFASSVHLSGSADDPEFMFASHLSSFRKTVFQNARLKLRLPLILHKIQIKNKPVYLPYISCFVAFLRNVHFSQIASVNVLHFLFMIRYYSKQF